MQGQTAQNKSDSLRDENVSTGTTPNVDEQTVPSLWGQPITSPLPSAESIPPRISSSARPYISGLAHSSSTRPLAALASASSPDILRSARFDGPAAIVARDSTPLPSAEKDADDPTHLSSRQALADARQYTTLTTLSRLFAAQTTSSRHPSFNDGAMPPLYTRCKCTFFFYASFLY